MESAIFERDENIDERDTRRRAGRASSDYGFLLRA